MKFGGSQVDITSGKFVFSVSEGYLIENGEVDDGVGTCGKEGQSVPGAALK